MSRLLSLAVLVAAALCFVRTAAADSLPPTITIMTWNLEWFFDEYKGDNATDLAKQQAAPSRAEWDWKLQGIAEAIAKSQPTILCLQEIENKRVLGYLRSRLKKEHNLDYSIAFVEGGDFFTEQDVAILCLSGLVEFSCREQTKEMRARDDFNYVSKHVFGRFVWGEGDKKLEMLVFNAHFRATPEGGPQRIKQARLSRAFVADEIAAGRNVVLAGDFNSEFAYADVTKADELGVLRGLETESKEDDLVDLHSKLPADGQNTHIIAKQFDHIFVSPRLVDGSGPGKVRVKLKSVAVRKELGIRGEQDKDHWNIYWTIPQAERDLSDHFPVVAEFEVVTE